MNKNTILEELVKIEMERQVRCGDGTGGKIISHSINCKCEYLNAKERDLQVDLSEVEFSEWVVKEDICKQYINFGVITIQEQKC